MPDLRVRNATIIYVIGSQRELMPETPFIVIRPPPAPA
jgi:hypothetical protein